MRAKETRRLILAGAAISILSCKGEDYTYRPPEETEKPMPRKFLPMPSHEPPAKEGPPRMEAREEEGGRLNTRTGRGCMEGMAPEGPFCIDRFEIVLLDRDGGMFPWNRHPPEHMEGLRAVSLPSVNPQGHLSQGQAAKACRNSGKRLCSSDEWEKACRGPNSNAFPYGPSPGRAICNIGNKPQHILDKYFPDIPHLKRAGREFNAPMLLLDPAYQTKTGQMAACVTLSGVYDLDGNMSEWVSDQVTKPGDGMVYGTFRGAPFSGGAHEGCARKTTGHDHKYYDYSLGTRCCADKK